MVLSNNWGIYGVEHSSALTGMKEHMSQTVSLVLIIIQNPQNWQKCPKKPI